MTVSIDKRNLPGTWLIDTFVLLLFERRHHKALTWLICFNFSSLNVFLGRNNFPISRQTENNSRVPCPNFSESRLPESSEIPNPVKIFCFFPNPGLHFGQIPYPENTLPDPDKTHLVKSITEKLKSCDFSLLHTKLRISQGDC